MNDTLVIVLAAACGCAALAVLLCIAYRALTASRPTTFEAKYKMWAKNPALPQSMDECREFLLHNKTCTACHGILQVALDKPRLYPPATKALWQHLPKEGLGPLCSCQFPTGTNGMTHAQSLHLEACDSCNKSFYKTTAPVREPIPHY
jgi:hypothetical protein